VIVSDQSTSAQVSCVKGQQIGSGKLQGTIEMSMMPLEQATCAIIEHLRLALRNSGTLARNDGKGLAASEETDLVLGSRFVKDSVPVSEMWERELDLVDDVNATPTQLLSRSVLAVQRHLPMAFPDLMYT
jgi:hypothetical protein